MNFKKMFGIVATVAMTLNLIPATVLGYTVSDAMQAAYDYAYEAGITTKTSAETANLNSKVTRAEMAKMISVFATEVLGLTADTTETDCEDFTDVSSSQGDLEDYIVSACQLGLMGRNNDGTVASSFNPSGNLTRAQYGTLLSRALYGDTYNGGNPWYGDHLAALEDDGIMTNISNPQVQELRRWVMKTMKTADEAGVVDTAGCNDTLTIAACAVGDASCPAECQTPDEVKAGSLTVSLGTNSLTDGTEVPSTGTIMFAAVNFKANSSDVTVRTVELKKLGLATVPTSTRVWFEKAGIRVSGKASFTSEGLAMISFAPAFVVKANATETLDLYVELATSANSDFQFASNSFDTTAVSVNGSFTTPRLRTANYAVAGITMDDTTVGGTANVTENGMELGAFTLENTDLSAETRDVKFKSVTLRQNGNASLSNLSNIVIERNGVVVSSNPTINSRDITFVVNDTVKDSTTATYYIKAIVNNVETDSDTYIFDLRNTTDLNAAEVNTAFRSTITDNFGQQTYTIQGGELTFARDSAYALSANYAAGSDVVLMKGTVTSKSAITVEDPTLNLSSAGITTGLDAMFSTLYLQVGSSTFSFSPTATNTGAAFLGAATINGTAQVKLYGKLKDTASATAKFNDLKLSSFRLAEYVSNGYTVATAIGAVAGISVTAQTPVLNVTRTDALGNTNMAAGSSNVKVYGLRLSSTQGNGVTISRIQLATTGNTVGTTGYNSNVDLNLYIDGVLVGTKTVTTGNLTAVTFDGFNKHITTTTPLDIEVRGNFTDAFSAGTFSVTLATGGLSAYDTLTTTAITSYSKPAGAVFTVNTAAGALAASNSNPVTTLFLSPSLAQKVMAFKLSATNDNVRLYDVTAAGALTGLSNFKLTDAAGVVLASATTATTTAVTFTSISNAPYVNKDTSASFFIVADVNSTTDYSPVTMSVATTGTTIKGSNGLTLNVTAGAAIASRTHAIAQNVPSLSGAVNSSKSLTTSALRFTVAAAGTNNVTLTGLTFNNALAGYTGTMVLRVYKTSVASINLAGEAPFVGTTSPTAVVMTGNSSANSVIDAGSTVEYIVAVEGALVDPGSNSTDRSISLTNAYGLFGAAASYNSIGALPFTSVK